MLREEQWVLLQVSSNAGGIGSSWHLLNFYVPFRRCHAWWEGPRCERKMINIPYKPLSERMLQEPFWLGLITVFVVLAIIGLVWCAKRHFPEKIEKLLAEEADRNRRKSALKVLTSPVLSSAYPSHDCNSMAIVQKTIYVTQCVSHHCRSLSLYCRAAGSAHSHHTSLREQLQFTTPIPQQSASNSNATILGSNGSGVGGAPGGHKGSIFGRLGIRKPSILSLSSPQPTGGAAARTFSLDDLLRPPPRRKTDSNFILINGYKITP